MYRLVAPDGVAASGTDGDGPIVEAAATRTRQRLGYHLQVFERHHLTLPVPSADRRRHRAAHHSELPTVNVTT